MFCRLCLNSAANAGTTSESPDLQWGAFVNALLQWAGSVPSPQSQPASAWDAIVQSAHHR